jgi:hypothetical protein
VSIVEHARNDLGWWRRQLRDRMDLRGVSLRTLTSRRRRADDGDVDAALSSRCLRCRVSKSCSARGESSPPAVTSSVMRSTSASCRAASVGPMASTELS